MSTTSAIIAGLCGVGCLACLARLPFAIRAARELSRGARCEGTVVAMRSDVVNEGWLADIVYRVDGREHLISLASNGGYRVGERVAVRYLPEDPTSADIDAPGRIWMDVIAAAILAAASAIAAIVLLVLGGLGVL